MLFELWCVYVSLVAIQSKIQVWYESRLVDDYHYESKNNRIWFEKQRIQQKSGDLQYFYFLFLKNVCFIPIIYEREILKMWKKSNSKEGIIPSYYSTLMHMQSEQWAATKISDFSPFHPVACTGNPLWSVISVLDGVHSSWYEVNYPLRCYN